MISNKFIHAKNINKKNEICTALIAEGDSAFGFLISGIDGYNDNIGIMSLKGKPLNVRKCSAE